MVEGAVDEFVPVKGNKIESSLGLIINNNHRRSSAI